MYAYVMMYDTFVLFIFIFLCTLVCSFFVHRLGTTVYRRYAICHRPCRQHLFVVHLVSEFSPPFGCTSSTTGAHVVCVATCHVLL